MTPTRSRATRWAGALAVAGLVMAACGDDSDDNGDDEMADPTPTTEAPEPELDKTDDGGDSDGTAAPAGDVTPPGTALSIGEAAVVPIQESTHSATVVSIEQGEMSDLTELFEDGDMPENKVPYYVNLSFEHVSGDAPSDLLGRGFSASEEGGFPAQPLTVISIGSTFEVCDDKNPDPAYYDAGATHESCLIFLVDDDGSAVTAAVFDGDRDSEYSDNPIVWGE